MASILQEVLAQFLKPEEHALGAELLAVTTANQAAIVAELQAKGVTALTALQPTIDAAIPAAFNACGTLIKDLEPVLEPYAETAVNNVIAQVVAGAPSESAVIGAWVIAAVKRLGLMLESA